MPYTAYWRGGILTLIVCPHVSQLIGGDILLHASWAYVAHRLYVVIPTQAQAAQYHAFIVPNMGITYHSTVPHTVKHSTCIQLLRGIMCLHAFMCSMLHTVYHLPEESQYARGWFAVCRLLSLPFKVYSFQGAILRPVLHLLVIPPINAIHTASRLYLLCSHFLSFRSVG